MQHDDNDKSLKDKVLAKYLEEQERKENLLETFGARQARKFEQRYVTGRLSFKEYKGLEEGKQRAYKRAFGRPKTYTEARHKSNKAKKRIRKNKIAKQSRRRNRK